MASLRLTALGRFLVLTRGGAPSGLQAVAAACVRDLGPFRAPATAAEVARPCPHVMEEFRFHLTLTGRLSGDAPPCWREIAAERPPGLPTPFVPDRIALCGERADGQFELLHRYALAG